MHFGNFGDGYGGTRGVDYDWWGLRGEIRLSFFPLFFFFFVLSFGSTKNMNKVVFDTRFRGFIICYFFFTLHSCQHEPNLIIHIYVLDHGCLRMTQQ